MNVTAFNSSSQTREKANALRARVDRIWSNLTPSATVKCDAKSRDGRDHYSGSIEDGQWGRASVKENKSGSLMSLEALLGKGSSREKVRFYSLPAQKAARRAGLSGALAAIGGALSGMISAPEDRVYQVVKDAWGVAQATTYVFKHDGQVLAEEGWGPLARDFEQRKWATQGELVSRTSPGYEEPSPYDSYPLYERQSYL